MPQSIGPGGRDIDGVALFGQPTLEKRRHPKLVLDHQNTHHKRLTSGNEKSMRAKPW
jgi:hypothetical protein